MPQTETWKNIETALAPRWDDALWSRGSTYAVLARAFEYPEETNLEYLRLCAEEGELSGEAARRLRAWLEEVASSSLEDLQHQHTAMFRPKGGPPPYEVQYRKFKDEFARAQELADIMGFYKAFGVEPRNERPDHLCAELEFMHYLVVKEKYARHQEDEENAELCRDAREKFFAEHLGDWVEDFAKEARAQEIDEVAPLYAELVEVLDTFIRSEQEKQS